MKIVHLLASPVWSGPAEPVALLALAQRQLGHEVTVAIDRKRLRVTSEELALPRFQELGLLDGSGMELSVKSTPWAIARDAWLLRRRECDVLHSHFTHDHLVARWARPRRARLIRSIHAPRSLTAATPRCDGFTVPFAGLLTRLGERPGMVLPALVDDTFHAPADRDALKRELGLPLGPVVGMASTLQASRRHSVAIDAFALLRERVPAVHLALLGDGEQEAALRARVLSLQLKDAVTFVGYRDATEFPRWMQAFDEVWVLGLGNDFAARQAAQARRCGARVVAVDEGALAEYADVLVPPEPAAVAQQALGVARRNVSPRAPIDVGRAMLDFYARVAR